MGIFSQRRPEVLRQNVRANLPGPGTYAIDVVGESKYQHELEEICGRRAYESQEKMVVAILIYENNNPYDNQAIRVEVNRKTVAFGIRGQVLRFAFRG